MAEWALLTPQAVSLPALLCSGLCARAIGTITGLRIGLTLGAALLVSGASGALGVRDLSRAVEGAARAGGCDFGRQGILGRGPVGFGRDLPMFPEAVWGATAMPLASRRSGCGVHPRLYSPMVGYRCSPLAMCRFTALSRVFVL